MSKILIPWDALVSDNRKNVKRGVLTKEYRAAKKTVAFVATTQVMGDIPMFDGECQVHYDFYPPDFRRRDCCNFLKLLNDSLEGVLWADDFQIKSLSFLVHPPDGTEPRVEIEASAR